MTYNRSGRSGLKLPAISLGLWHNFGAERRTRESAPSCRRPSTSASPISTSPTITAPSARRRGDRLRARSWHGLPALSRRDGDLHQSRLRHVAGPLRRMGSRKYMLASLDQSLKRMGLDYVDIFYSHRFDPETPLEETMGALDTRCVRARRSMSASPPTIRQAHARGGAILQRAGHAAAHPPAVLFDAQSLGRGDGLLDALGRGASAASPSRRSPRGC